MYCFTTKWPNFQVVLCIIKAYVCFHILAKGHQGLTFFVQYMMYCFTTKWPNFQVVLCIIKAYVCFHILAKGHQVLTFFICSVYGVLFYNKMAKLSSSTMHNKGLCVLLHIDKKTSDVIFFYLFSIWSTVLQQNGQTFK